MPLIKCTMCEREISPNAVSCPHCGEPMKNNNEDVKYEVVLQHAIQKIKIIAALRTIKNLDLKQAVHIVDNLPASIEICDTYEQAEKIVAILKEADVNASFRISEVGTEKRENLTTVSNNKVKCPNCGSTYTQAISTASKVTSGLLFGLFASSRIVNSWECKTCKYKW